MCDCLGLFCPSYPFPPPLIPQCLLQRACSSSSILGCSEKGCHTNQCLAFCRQREHSWHSNQPKQLLCCFSGTGGGHCSGIEASQQEWREQPGTLRSTAPQHLPAMASGAHSSKSGYWISLSVPLPTPNWWGCFPALGVFSHPSIRGHQLTRKQLLGVSFGRRI